MWYSLIRIVLIILNDYTTLNPLNLLLLPTGIFNLIV